MHKTEESQLKKNKNSIQNSLFTTINGYDSDVQNGEKTLSEAKGELDILLAQVQEKEDEYRQVLHEKEVNKALRDEWEEKIKKFKIHEQRKRAASKLIFGQWSWWKASKKKKGRRGRGKKK